MTVARGELRRAGDVSYEVIGEQGPVTVYGHGLAGTADDCRPWAGVVGGTGVLVELRGHGRSGPVPAEGWDYQTYADDLLAVADAVGATAIVGVSVSAGAWLRVLAAQPDRFAAAVLALPAALDSPRTDAATARLSSLGVLAQAGDVAGITAAMLAELPPDVAETRLARIWATRRASRLVSAPPPYPRPGGFAAIADRRDLADVSTPTLVLGETGDPLHLLHLAEDLAAALPQAELAVLPHGSLFWTRRDETAKRIAEHLAR